VRAGSASNTGRTRSTNAGDELDEDEDDDLAGGDEGDLGDDDDVGDDDDDRDF
jgi:hypothetical protein